MTLTTAPLRPKRVVIVDDSRTIRALIRASLAEDPRLEVAGEAGDPFEARDVIKATNPDIITLDVEMPKMNGLVFLQNLMRLRPMPVVMVSSRTKENSEDAIRALSIGAVDCVHVARLQTDPAQRARFAETIHTAAGARVAQRPAAGGGAAVPPASRYHWNNRIVLIGSSTGGVDALERVFETFPADGPPVLVAQHMPPGFLASFAKRLDERMAPKVQLAAPGAIIKQGNIYIGQGGDYHIGVEAGAQPRIATPQATGDELYVPTVNILFQSALSIADRVLGVVLTGMGRDGADGLLALRRAGAGSLVQSGDSAVIDGMPKAAREIGASAENVHLDTIGGRILELCSNSGPGGANL